jgi:hypothetical protein
MGDLMGDGTLGQLNRQLRHGSWCLLRTPTTFCARATIQLKIYRYLPVGFTMVELFASSCPPRVQKRFSPNYSPVIHHVYVIVC